MIDPHIQGVLEAMAEGGFQMPDPLDAASLRAVADAPIPAPPVNIAEKRNVEIEADGRSIPTRLYHSAPEEHLPVVLFFHGGGWVHGTLDTHDRLCAHLAAEAHCAVVSVDYRLAPENPFPAAWDDARAALDWLVEQGDRLNIDVSRIALAGDSAGGNLAAALAQSAAGNVRIVHQLLFYPVTDGRCTAPSYDGDHAGFLSSQQMRWYWDQYAPGSSRTDPRASINEGSIASNMAPATIIVAGNDPLHDEGVAYAKAVEKAGVATTLYDYPSAIHGFASLFGMIPLADEVITVAVGELKAAFESLPSPPP